jgi:hypothetical protein
MVSYASSQCDCDDGGVVTFGKAKSVRTAAAAPPPPHTHTQAQTHQTRGTFCAIYYRRKQDGIARKPARHAVQHPQRHAYHLTFATVCMSLKTPSNCRRKTSDPRRVGRPTSWNGRQRCCSLPRTTAQSTAGVYDHCGCTLCHLVSREA